MKARFSKQIDSKIVNNLFPKLLNKKSNDLYIIILSYIYKHKLNGSKYAFNIQK
jgi:hypothetical protein